MGLQRNGGGRIPLHRPVGRGVGQLLAGLFPNKVNSTTGKISWPNNALEPDYEWLDQYNAVSGGSLCSTGDTNSIAANRDFYCYTLTWNGSSFVGAAFNGTVGTGSGTLSARPSSCTKNVAYWATDDKRYTSARARTPGQLITPRIRTRIRLR